MMAMKDLTERQLVEWSLARAYQEFQRGAHQQFGIVSGWRSNRDWATNLHNTEMLKHDLGSWGYVQVEGFGDEGGGKISHEPSFWVNGISFQDIKALAKKYDQYSFIYGFPESTTPVAEYRVSGGTVRTYKKFSPTDLAKYYSKWKGRPFRFKQESPMQFTNRLLTGREKE